MAVERQTGGTSLIDVLDRVLDKGIVIDAWVRVSLVGIDLITVEARVVVASIDTYLKYSEAVGQVSPVSRPQAELTAHQNVHCGERGASRGVGGGESHQARRKLTRATQSHAARAAGARPPKGNGCTRRSRRSCRSRPVELEAKLGLAEFLLASTDLQASARRAVDWLVSHSTVRYAIVAFAEPASSQLLHPRRARHLQRRHRRLRRSPARTRHIR